MVGGPESMVAIVRGTKDAGLAVTVMRRHAFKPTAVTGTLPPTHTKSSVETTIKGSSLANAGVQICDDRYASSYKLAHSNVRAPSPPFLAQEFPMHSPEIHRNLLTNSQSSRGTDAFVSSLRKYPSVSPDRSTEFVRRLTAYSHAKNFSKGSYHTKSIRNLRNKTIKRQSEDGNISMPSQDSHINSHAQHLNGKREDAENTEADSTKCAKNSRTSSPLLKRNKSSRYREHQLNGTYDYLKSVRCPGRNPEVRYLNDVTRCLRDSIRQICDDTPHVCPYIESRYSRHRRRHHEDTIRQRSSTDSKDTHAQGNLQHGDHVQELNVCPHVDTYPQINRSSVPSVSRGVLALSCKAPPGTYDQEEQSSAKFCCHCKKTSPCACTSKAQTTDSHMTENYKHSDYIKKLEEQINNWLKEIPVNMNDKPENNEKRKILIKDLVEKLKPLKQNEHYEENAKKEIVDCVNSLPMWHPMSKRDQEDFKNQVVNNLFNKIRNVSMDFDKFRDGISELLRDISFKDRNSLGKLIDKEIFIDNLIEKLNTLATNPPSNKTMKYEVAEILKEFPIALKGDETEYINNLANQLADKIINLSVLDSNRNSEESIVTHYQSKISDWVDKFPELCYDGKLNDNEKQELILSLAKKLGTMQSNDPEDIKNHENMQNEIIDWLDKYTKNRLKNKNKIARELLQSLVNISITASSKEESLNENELTNQILKWFKDIPELLSMDSENEIAQQLAQILLRTQGKNDSTMEKAITQWLTDKNKRISTSTQINLAKKLVNNLNTIKSDKHLKKQVWNCLRDVMEQRPIDSVIADRVVNEMQKLRLQTKNLEEDEIRYHIDQFLNGLPKASGLNLIGSQKNKLVQELALIVKAPKQRKRWSKEESLHKMISHEISRIMDEPALNLSRSDKKTIKDKIISLVSKYPGPIKSSKYEDLKMEVTDIIEENSQISSRTAKSVAENILHELQEQLTNTLEKESIFSTFSFDKMRGIADDEEERPLQQVSIEMLKNVNESDCGESDRDENKVIGISRKLSMSLNNQESSQSLDNLSKIDKYPWQKRIPFSSDTSKINEYSKDGNDDIRFQPTNNSPLVDNLSTKETTSNKNESHTIKTSTPRKPLDKRLSFQRYSTVPSASVILGDDISQPYPKRQMPSKDETQYMSQLVDKIDGWIHSLDIKFDKDDELSKETMIKELACDIIDRQKYLQLNPTSKTCDEEELENLKYQIFRQLNKLPSTKNIIPSINGANDLMEIIKEVPVPQLVKETNCEIERTDSVQKYHRFSHVLENKFDNWIKSLPLKSAMMPSEKKQLEHFKHDVLKKVRELDNLQLDSDEENDPKISEDIMSLMHQIPLNSSAKKNHKLLEEKVKELCSVFKDKDSQTKALKYRIKSIIDHWSQNLPFKSGYNFQSVKNKVNDLGFLVQDLTKNVSVGTEEIKTKLEKATNSLLNTLPLEIKDSYSTIQALVNPILELIKTHSNATEDQTTITALEQTLNSELTNKIADLNANPEIFNDESLYEYLLKCEIDELVSKLPQTPNVEKNISTLKNKLIANAKDAKEKTRNVLAGHAYKQQLQDVISNTLPYIDNLSQQEQIPFEIIKNTLADAYINLLHSADSEPLKNKYKQEIGDEITRFCNDYLKRFPANPVDSIQLNEELYIALQNVPFPKEDTLKAQVEQIRIKDDIKDWIKDLPLTDESESTELQKQKMVTLLAKALHEIEEEKYHHPSIDVGEKMTQEIKNWMKKLPLKAGVEIDSSHLASELVYKLKSTEESRRLSLSKVTDITGTVPNWFLPQSTLTENDQEHLERIRQRSQIISSTPLAIEGKDTSISPVPIDAGSQTDVGPHLSCPMNSQMLVCQPYDYLPCNHLPNQPISPNVIVNEYNWENTDATLLPRGMCPGKQSQEPSGQCCLDINQPQLPDPSAPCSTLNQCSSSTQPPYISMLPTCSSSQTEQKRQIRANASQPPCMTPQSHLQTPKSQLSQPPSQSMRPCLTPRMGPTPCVNRPQFACSKYAQTIPPNTQMPSYYKRPPFNPSNQPPCDSAKRRSLHIQLPTCAPRDEKIDPVPAQTRKYFRSPDFSSTPLDENDASRSKSIRSQLRVTKLGSLNEPLNKNDMTSHGSQSPKATSSRESPNEDSDWTIQLPVNADNQCRRKRTCRICIPSADAKIIRERTEEKSRCRERIPTKNKKPRSCRHSPCLSATESMRHCSKCCGVYCPHPSNLYFN